MKKINKIDTSNFKHHYLYWFKATKQGGKLLIFDFAMFWRNGKANHSSPLEFQIDSESKIEFLLGKACLAPSIIK